MEKLKTSEKIIRNVARILALILVAWYFTSYLKPQAEGFYLGQAVTTNLTLHQPTLFVILTWTKIVQIIQSLMFIVFILIGLITILTVRRIVKLID